MSRDIRQQALEKLAQLSVLDATSSGENGEFNQLFAAYFNKSKSRDGTSSSSQRLHSRGGTPMTIKEFEVVIALCQSCPNVQSSQIAQRIVHQLTPYITDAHSQTFAQSPHFARISPCPTEVLTFHVSAALLVLGNKFKGLRDRVGRAIAMFLDNCTTASERLVPSSDDKAAPVDDPAWCLSLSVALLGFIDALSPQLDFWKVDTRASLAQQLHGLLSERFYVTMERSLSTIRVGRRNNDRESLEWKNYLDKYSLAGRPLSTVLLQRSLSWLLLSTASLLLVDAKQLKQQSTLDILWETSKTTRPGPRQPLNEVKLRSSVTIAHLALQQVDYVDATADYVAQLGSSWHQRLSFSVKSAALTSYLICGILNEEASDLSVLATYLINALSDDEQMGDESLSETVLKSLAVICRVSPELGPSVSRVLPRYLVQSVHSLKTIDLASQSLAYVLQLLSKDAIITTLYSLGNILSSVPERPSHNHESSLGTVLDEDGFYHGQHPTNSTFSLQLLGEDDVTGIVYDNIVHTICSIAETCGDDKITALAQSILVQKVDKVSSSVDARIITGTSSLALGTSPTEFRGLLKLYMRIAHVGVVEHRNDLLRAVLSARNYLSANLQPESNLYSLLGEHLLNSIVSLGDLPQSSQTKEADVQLAAQEISQLLQPLAIFMASGYADKSASRNLDDDIHTLLRDAWFNIVVHGFLTNTDLGRAHIDDLRTIAVYSPPLVAEQRGEQLESDIELNTVLRRGMNSEREAFQKRLLLEFLPSRASDIKGLSYRRVIFLQASHLVESLRAEAGACTRVLSYFVETSMSKPDVNRCMESIMFACVDKYLRRALRGTEPTFSAQYIAAQLAVVFCHCCHRIERVQQAAFACADRILQSVPSVLCYRSALYALLELLTLMWKACLEAETDTYQPKSIFTSKMANVAVELSDDYEYRRHTLSILHRKSREWITEAVSRTPADVKGLLQTYLSDYEDEGGYRHISLGRSVALELGGLIPNGDQILRSIDGGSSVPVNSASDFVAQYTNRQEYRYGQTLPDHGSELVSLMFLNRRPSFAQHMTGESSSAATALQHIEARILSKKVTPFSEIKELLRRAAALLCRSDRDESTTVHHLVSIPCALFTKQSIRLGVSLWLGVMNENPRLEPRLLNEIMLQWERTIQRQLGLFSRAVQHPDPFFLKAEFAPSELEALGKRQAAIINKLAPHTSILHFFNSHFSALRLASPDLQHVFLRMLDKTLDAMKHAGSHPLAREIRFQIILFGLRVLHHGISISAIAQWRLKDKLLSAALNWFSFAPRWSFGSNSIQLQAEIQLISDVIDELRKVSSIGSQGVGNLRSLESKEQLLVILLENEQSRLVVWAYPTAEHSKLAGILTTSVTQNRSKVVVESNLLPLVRTAWLHNPSLAIALAQRFPYPRLQRDIRLMLINNFHKAIRDPDGLTLLLGSELPEDINILQLRNLLFWAPVNPITAVTLFLPAFQNDPFVIQYAMRALESHSVDITFFYVPQIVQTLRYDALGYVQRYILETAQFSQLFAHQIIWNMKANSYKDDDAQVEDAIKPTLDSVMMKMVARFSDVDREFYQREFSFFEEVTGISGKLKPLIKRSKPEKKQKIEEELRKIKVDVGVYLPSNPDGIVIGIDRKSGKPLQSHAKAPYMATFRIQKNKVLDKDAEELDPKTTAVSQATPPTALTKASRQNSSFSGTVDTLPSNSIELWQSAIFKVGDDCRQDVLALQLIAAFRSIFQNVGLDVYVFPYRVIATAPGCGVIEVLPNSISRDMLGREAVNGLYDYFITKYGNENSLRFQKARGNFVKSMAAYSVISFLLQFKDRHNGNIMIDDAGHILHIDFGFCFDIAPGGIKFERAPFKLTSEMVAVMGGNTEHQSFRWFEELCVKAFLASRQHVEKLCQIVVLMMDSGLPCFRPETVRHFRERFVLEKSEREAADFMKDLIRKSFASYSTGIYDQFQLLTNGIPF